MSGQAERDAIWEGDRLGRRKEAEMIERFLTKEVEFFQKLRRDESVVLGIDAPYGKGKSWFLERLANQLRLSHPVARIDAWADDVGDEPLTAFMAAIDDALAPYLKVSINLRNRMAAVKAASLPVIGKLFMGTIVKVISKVAGDQIQDQLGTVIEDAVLGARERVESNDQGAAAAAVTTALETVGAEIESLVDRKGAAMLAAYRQRRQSRQIFRERMRDLVAAIDHADRDVRSPLIVVIDELDRCRPNYAIRMLEEIKHFFEVPGVVFILGLHGGQLSKSVKAIYGAEFDSDDYLRRFFTRRYELKSLNVVNLTYQIFNDYDIDENKFVFPDLSYADEICDSKSKILGAILSHWDVTPREIYPIMDGLRLFVDGWEYPEHIEPISLLSLLVKMVRGQPFDFEHSRQIGDFLIKGISWHIDSHGTPSPFNLSQYLAYFRELSDKAINDILRLNRGRDPARNYLVELVENENKCRRLRNPNELPFQSHLSEYKSRIRDLARFVNN